MELLLLLLAQTSPGVTESRDSKGSNNKEQGRTEQGQLLFSREGRRWWFPEGQTAR